MPIRVLPNCNVKYGSPQILGFRTCLVRQFAEQTQQFCGRQRMTLAVRSSATGQESSRCRMQKRKSQTKIILPNRFLVQRTPSPQTQCNLNVIFLFLSDAIPSHVHRYCLFFLNRLSLPGHPAFCAPGVQSHRPCCECACPWRRVLLYVWRC